MLSSIERHFIFKIRNSSTVKKKKDQTWDPPLNPCLGYIDTSRDSDNVPFKCLFEAVTASTSLLRVFFFFLDFGTFLWEFVTTPAFGDLWIQVFDAGQESQTAALHRVYLKGVQLDWSQIFFTWLGALGHRHAGNETACPKVLLHSLKHATFCPSTL